MLVFHFKLLQEMTFYINTNPQKKGSRRVLKVGERWDPGRASEEGVRLDCKVIRWRIGGKLRRIGKRRRIYGEE